MSTVPIHEQLTRVFRDVFGDDELRISDETTAADVKGWDSLNHIRLMLTVQRTFRVRITAAEVSQLRSVGDLVRLLQSRLGEAGGNAR